MNLSRKSGIAAIILLSLVLVSCGDTFRPIATPIVQPGGDPQRLGRAIVLNSNGGNPGSATIINVSGDTNMGVMRLGQNPVHGSTLGQVNGYSANENDDNITAFTFSAAGSIPTNIPLPAGASPRFVTIRNPKLFVAESGRDRVAVLDLQAAPVVLTTEVPVGTTPVAMALGQAVQKLYVVNQGSDDVTVIQTVDNAILVPSLTVGASPSYAVASSDGTMVFVANEADNTVSVIRTDTDVVLTTIPVGAGPAYLFFDRGLRRLYTVNKGDDTISIIRADQPLPALPTLLATVSVAAAPCSSSGPEQVTALVDRSRAYVVNSGTNNVCVLNTGTNLFTKSITVGTNPVAITSSPDSTKVYVASRGGDPVTDPGETNIIRTSDDTVVTSIVAPLEDPTCVNPAPPAAPVCSTAHQQPQFIMMSPQ